MVVPTKKNMKGKPNGRDRNTSVSLSDPRADVRFHVRGKTYTLDEMETVYDDRWNFGEKATIIALQDGGFGLGDHKVEFGVRMRVSYHPSYVVPLPEKHAFPMGKFAALHEILLAEGVPAFAAASHSRVNAFNAHTVQVNVAAVGVYGGEVGTYSSPSI